jgi:hypothetical protein
VDDRLNSALVRALALILLGGCILQDVSLDGKVCPCAAGYVCDESVRICVRAPDAGAAAQLGDECASDDECASELCHSNGDSSYCTMPCGRTADCPLSFTCAVGPGGDRTCAPERIFAGASFTTPSGEACAVENSTCQSGICDPSALACVERCARDEHCSSFGTGCIVREVFSEECGPPVGAGAAGDTCTANAECASGICNKYESACAAPCCTDADCGADESCLDYDIDTEQIITVCRPSGAGTTPLGMPCASPDECTTGICSPIDPSDPDGAKICSVRCCTHADCAGIEGGFCRSTPGVLSGAAVPTCFPGD